MILAIVLSGIGGAFGYVAPMIIQRALDIAVPDKNMRLLFSLVATLIAIYVVSVIFTTIRSRIMVDVSQNIIYDIRKDLFEHLQELPFQYYDDRPHGKILIRVVNYVNSVSDMLSNGLINIVLEAFNLLFIIIFMFMVDVQMALVVLCGVPVLISVLTRMEEAPNMIETEPVNLTTMMRNILNEVTLELEEKQITAHNMLPERLTVQGNSSLLYSIFRNLTDNAIAYAGSHISITIRCFREDERFYYFSFSDTGVGVDPEHLSRLFERFYRVDKGRSRKLGGTGLGLAIVKNAVILHGGTIFAKNTPGGGLEFIFTLSKE